MRIKHLVLAAALSLLVPRLAEAATTITVTNQALLAYLFNGASPNGTLTLQKGQTYIFNVQVNGHPFHIVTAPGIGAGGVTQDFVDPGLTGQGAMLSTGAPLVFTVPSTAPAQLFYQCGNHTAMTGTINIVAATASVPATNHWALLGLGGLVLVAGFLTIRRRLSVR
jgi:hypothetical protein